MLRDIKYYSNLGEKISMHLSGQENLIGYTQVIF